MKTFLKILDTVTLIMNLLSALMLAYGVLGMSLQLHHTNIYLFNLKIFASGAILAWFSFSIDAWLDWKIKQIYGRTNSKRKGITVLKRK